MLFYNKDQHLVSGSKIFRPAVIVSCAIGSVSLPCSAVLAQTSGVESSPFALPLVGQAPANTALSSVNAGNVDQLTVVPSFRTVYDTNVLRRDGIRGAPTDNFRVTPGIDVSVRRQFARVAANFSGSAGYDFNSRYRFLNRTRIDFTGGLRAPVGAICSANVTAAYDQYQFDLADVKQTVASTTRNQNYDIDLACSRAAGFSPIGGATYHAASSDGLGVLDYTQISERIGLAFAKPSLGRLTLSGTASQLRRPNLFAATGMRDDTNVRIVSLALDRDVSKRVQLGVAIGYTRATPARGSVSSYSGLSYNARLNWNITPFIILNGSAIRQVTNQNGISATYVVRDDYQAVASWQFSRASQISLSAFRIMRGFRGEGLTPTLSPILSDRTNITRLNYQYDSPRWLRLGVSLGHQWRTADNAGYDYQSTTVSGSIGTRF